MSDKPLEIKPQIGLGTLLFGSTKSQVKNIFGEPSEIETIEEEEGNSTIVWHYWDHGFTVFFEREDDLFTSVEVDNSEATLWGKRIFELTEKEILWLFSNKGFKDFESEVHEWGEKRVTFEELLVDLYFEKNQLVSINFGAVIDKNEIIFWPN
jgi:hypothetical protein